MLTCVVIGLLFPVFSVCYLIAPKSPLGLFIRKPFIKFICHTASYLTFLFLLLLASQHIDRSDLSMQGPPPTVVEWMILPWVLGKCITKENTVKSILTTVVLPSIPEAGYSRVLSWIIDLPKQANGPSPPVLSKSSWQRRRTVEFENP